MKLYGMCGKSDPCFDRRFCTPERGSRSAENRLAFKHEEAGGELDAFDAEFEDIGPILIITKRPS